jgi:hypothetical protein
MSVAEIYTYIGHFFSGEVDPTIPHLVLILTAIGGGVAVGAGIIWEAARSGHLFTWPTAFVFFGVLIEAAATVVLFQFDETISHNQASVIRAQNDKIILLDTELAKVRLPRTLSQDAIQRIATKLRKYEGTPFDFSVTPAAEGSFLEDMRRMLDFAHWDHLAFGGFALSFDELRVTNGLPHAGIVASVTGVRVAYDSSNPLLREPSEALARSLSDEGFDAKAEALSGLENGNPPMKATVIHVQIGNRV